MGEYYEKRKISTDDRFLTEKAKKVKAVCQRYNVPLIINDDVTAAIDSGADGVHVGADDMNVSEIRRMAGDDFIIGATAKTVEQALSAQSQGAGYLGCGALFASSTKKNAKPMTAEMLREIISSVTIPVVAIGGLTYDNIDIIKGSGAAGAAFVSAVFAQTDTEATAEKLKAKMEEVINVSQTL